MRNFRNTSARALLAMAVVATVAACSKKADDAVVTADTSAMSVPPAAPALRVSAVETGKAIDADKSIADDMHDFAVRDTIYAAVKTEGTGTGTLAAKWTFQDGQVVEESSQNIAPTGDAWHEFHIMKATAWPKGNYKVEVTLDGVAVGSKDVTVK